MDHRPTAGFDAVTEFSGDPKPGQVMIVGNGGTVLFYVIGHDPAITRRLVEFLQQTDFAGVEGRAHRREVSRVQNSLRGG